MVSKPPTGLEIDHDDDGNPLAVPDPTSNVGQLIYLLEWARQRGFRVGPTIQIGDLVVQVQDIRQASASHADEPDPGPWRQAGYVEGDA